jgi:hypothetical protein
MSSLLMFKPIFPVAIKKLSGGAEQPNLMTPDPKEVSSINSNAAWSFYLDYGAPVTLDTWLAGYFTPIETGGHINNVQTTTAYDDTGLAGVPSVPDSGDVLTVTGRRRVSFWRALAPTTSRYWRIRISQTTASAVTNFGLLLGGLAIQPAWGHEWGAGRQPLDMSNVAPLRGGGFGIERGARKSAWQFTCGDLTDAEVQALHAMAEDIGISSPVVVCEDPDMTDGLNERLHYGLFDRPEAYVRESPGQTRWSFRVQEWV